MREKIETLTKQIGKFFGAFAEPNHCTYLALIVGLVAAYFIYVNQFVLAIFGILIAGFLDYVDGAIAKAMKKETKWGAMLDSVVDKITELAIYFALALFSNIYFFGSLLAASAFMLSSYISKHAGAIGAKMGGGLLERKERYALILIGLIFLVWQNTIIMLYILYVIGVLSLFTALQRMERTKKFLESEVKKTEK